MAPRTMRSTTAWILVAALLALVALSGCQGEGGAESVKGENLPQDARDQEDSRDTLESADAARGKAYEEGVALVVFERSATVEDVVDALADLGATCPIGIEQADIDSGACVVVTLPDGAEVPEAAEALQALNVVEAAQPNYRYGLF